MSTWADSCTTLFSPMLSIPQIITFCLSGSLAVVASAKTANPLDRVTPAPANEPVPIVDFFRPWVFKSPRLNSTGTHFAALVSTGDYNDLLVYDLAKKKGHRQAGDETHSITDFDWMDDRNLLLTISTNDVYSRGLLATQIGERGLKTPIQVQRYSVAVPLGFPRQNPLHPLIWILRGVRGTSDTGADIGAPDGVIVKINARQAINSRIPTQKFGELLWSYTLPPDGDPVRYLTDADSELAFSITEKNGIPSLHRLDKDAWIPCPVDLDQIDVLGTGDHPGELIALGPRQAGKPRAMLRLDASAGQFGEVLHADDLYDAERVYFHRRPSDGHILGCSYIRKQPSSHWFDPEYAQIQINLDQALPGEVVRILGSDDKEQRFFLSASADRHPPRYYYFDREKAALALVGPAAPWIDPDRMRPMTDFSYKARDGIAIEAFLTLPAGTSKQKPAPLLVLPHGGPWARDFWGWDAEVQFLASRGYAVFQPNYRGSTGYDWKFPAEDQWAFRKMHNDVTDGVRRLVSSGLIDPARIAIMGSSFGGYLAICGAAYEPDLYRCAITIAGVFDWERVIKDARSKDQSVRLGYYRRHLGDPKTEAEKFERINPLQQAEQIKIPVFVAHGDKDDIADISQSKRLIQALEKYNVPHEVKIKMTEGHGFHELENQVELYAAIEVFLARNLAPRPATAATPSVIPRVP